MTIVDKYSIRTPLVVAVLMIVLVNVIYFSFVNYTQKNYYNTLKRKSKMRDELFFEILNQNTTLLNKLDKQSTLLYNNEEYCLYDEKGKLVYQTLHAKPRLNSKILGQLNKEKEVRFIENDEFYLFFVNVDDDINRSTIIEISGNDYEGKKTQDFILKLLIISTLTIIVVTTLITRFLTKKEIKPIGQIAAKIQHLTESNLSEKLDEAQLENEIGQMATAFNSLLGRIDMAYSRQQNFASYVTHELRTPLTIMLGNADVALMKDRSTSEYQNTLQTIKDEIKGLIKLVNDLLELAYLNANPTNIKLEPVRIDDILFQARTQLLQKSHSYIINIDFVEIPDSIDSLIINGNPLLLRLAFINLMENACKYNDERTVDVRIKTLIEGIDVIFEDNGYGISEDDLKNIFEPYFRSIKVQQISGHGIGLPLTKRIINIHKGEISIASQLGKGTKITTFFKS